MKVQHTQLLFLIEISNTTRTSSDDGSVSSGNDSGKARHFLLVHGAPPTTTLRRRLSRKGTHTLVLDVVDWALQQEVLADLGLGDAVDVDDTEKGKGDLLLRSALL